MSLAKYLVPAAAVAALGFGAAQAETAQSIQWQMGSMPAQTGDWKTVSGSNVLGAMVNPNGCTEFWDSSMKGQGSWTWGNDGSNANTYGMVFNFKISNPPGNASPEQTAIGCVTVDPTQVSAKDVTITVNLEACSIGPGNPQLKVATSGQSGVSVQPVGGQPACN